jgi:hypothetical protein
MARFNFGWWMVVGMLGTALPSLGALQYELESCDTPEFATKYHNLVANEPAIGLAFEKMVEAAGGNVSMHSCRFMVPVENGAITNGPRRFVLDKTWETIRTTDGVETRIRHHHGMVVEYVLKKRQLSDGNVAESRHVVSFQVCRTPATCQRLGFQL